MSRASQSVTVIVLMAISAPIFALVLHTVALGWGFRPDVDPAGHFPIVFLVGMVGALIVAACTTCGWGIAWAVVVGAACAAILPVQYLAGSELEPDQRVSLFFGPPVIFFAALLGGCIGAWLGARLAGQRE